MDLEDIKDKMEEINERGTILRQTGETESVLSIIKDYNRGLVSLFKHTAAIAIMVGVPLIIIIGIIVAVVYIGG